MTRKFLPIFSGALCAVGLALTIVGGVVSSNNRYRRQWYGNDSSTTTAYNMNSYERIYEGNTVYISGNESSCYYIALTKNTTYCFRNYSSYSLEVEILDYTDRYCYLQTNVSGDSYVYFTTDSTTGYNVYVYNSNPYSGLFSIYS